jgi:hypothetical protein
MRVRARYLSLTLLVLAAAALILGKRVLYPAVSPRAASLTAPDAQSYLIILGNGDTKGAVWDGSIAVTGADIVGLQGWRFSGTDSISGNSWKMATRLGPVFTTAGPVQENGLIVTVPAATSPVTFDVKTTQGNFSFSSRDVPFGGAGANGVPASASFLSGRALVARTGVPLQLTSSPEEEDFPSMTQSGDDVYLTYTQFVHGDRSQAVPQSTKQAITDFAFLSRPAGGDQVFLLHYSKAQRVWTGPFAVTNAGEDAMRSAVTVDGQGRAWVIYSAQRNGNFDLYARNSRADGTMSSEIRLTSDPGTDLFPVAATDSTGRVWVAWQGFRNNNLEVLASVQNGDSFWPETLVSTSPASDWDPAIATAANGEVAISWDTYDKGDYDVYVRRVRFTDQIGIDAPIPVAATLNFEARSSLAYDPQNRLWIAYEFAGATWGKDFGTYDTTGIGLYQNHTTQVRCLVGNDLYSTTQDVATVLPGQPANQLFGATIPGPYAAQPDPSLGQNRNPGDDAAFSPIANEGPKNSFPRLATDADGTVYLAFRRPTGGGLSTSHATGGISVGSIWMGALVYFDGSQWHGPGYLANSDAVGDNRPSILPVGPGHLLIAQSTDHRLSPLPNGTPAADGVNSDIYALDLPVVRTQQPPALTKLPPATPAAPDPASVAEAATAVLSRSYRPSVNGQQYQLVRGDYHRHTEVSFDGARDGPLMDAYRYAIDAASLGWLGCCDHDNGEAREYTWWLNQKFNDAYLLGSKFVPMYYYERSVAYPEGHRNIMFAQRGVRTLPRLPTTQPGSPAAPAPDTTMLYAYLHFFSGLSAPHTSATDQGTDWRNNDPVVEPFVEIYQGARQNYEMPGAPRDNSSNDSISGYEAAGYVSNALGKGYQLGFEASSDHVSTHISFTNIWVATPTRAGILDALRKRRVYGSTDNIVADFRSGTHFMGEAFTTSTPPIFLVRLWGTAPFQKVVVVKDNNVAYSTSGDRALAFTYQDTAATKGKTSYYYVRGVQTDGQIVWVSPMWVTLQ